MGGLFYIFVIWKFIRLFRDIFCYLILFYFNFEFVIIRVYLYFILIFVDMV